VIRIATGIVWALLGAALILGAPSEAQQPSNHINGDGFYVDCRGNGDGGYRRCDVHVFERKGAPVHRMDVNLYTNEKRFDIGIVSWGYNGGKDKGKNGNPDVDSGLDQYRVVRP
jgi:hypothetical protein